MSAVMMLLAVGACGNDGPSPSSTSASATPSTSATDLSAIACATEDPEGVGRLTGVWAGSEGGMYYVRQVGDCIWWFGTDVRDIEPGLTDQAGFANVASGRVNGDRIDLEWADLPLGDTLGGGGLTLVYDAENDAVLANPRALELHGMPPASAPLERWDAYYDARWRDGTTARARELPLARAIRGEPSMPIFTASAPISDRQASICAATSSGESASTAWTPRVSCAVTQVIAVIA